MYPPLELQNVLSTVVNSGFAHSETCEPSSTLQPYDVYGPVSVQFLPGEKPLHDM